MKRIRFIVQHKEGKESWEETTKCPDDISPEVYARSVIENFNNILRPFEKPRELVEILDDVDLPPEHDWEKQNLFTIIDRSGTYDKYKCRTCGVTGKRFGLGGISRDKEYQADKYKFCKPIWKPKLNRRRLEAM